MSRDRWNIYPSGSAKLQRLRAYGSGKASMLRAFRIRENRVPRILLFTLFFPTLLVANLSCQEHPPKHSGSTPPPIRQMAGAKDAFESVCASCHGLDGKGGERGPNIASRPEAVHKSAQELMLVLP